MGVYDDEPTQEGYSSAVLTDRHRDEDVAMARRGAATFGGEYRPGNARRALRQFVAQYGWRAYALPLLVVVTVAALVTMHDPASQPRRVASGSQGPSGSQGHSAPAPPPAADGQTTLKSDAPSANSYQSALSAAALPKGAAFTKSGDGTFRVLKGTTKVFGSGPLYRYDIEVENGITGIDLKQYQSLVDSTLADPRSWSGHGVSLQRVDSGSVDFHITLVSMMTVRQLCGYEIHVETSCFISAGNGNPVNRVVLDDARWVRGAASYLGDITAYRQYLINHEDGHALGHNHAHECLPGGLAPAMMEQTVGMVDAQTGKLCQANPWPYPKGVKGAPGAEAPDTPQNSEFQLGGE